MDPRAGEGRVGILPWIGPPEKSRGRKQKGGRGCVLIRGERERERGTGRAGNWIFGLVLFAVFVRWRSWEGRGGGFRGRNFARVRLKFGRGCIVYEMFEILE